MRTNVAERHQHGDGGEETAPYSTDGVAILKSEPNFSCCAFILFALLAASLICAWVWIFNYLGGLGREDTIDPNPYFNWHPFLMTTGFLLLSFSALSYRLVPGLHTTQKTVHGVINTIVGSCVVAGVVIAVRWHNLVGLPHFFSVHSWIGLLTLALLLAQYIMGFIAFVYPTCHPETAAYFKLFHKWLGMTAYAVFFANIIIGLLNKQRFIPGDLFGSARVFANSLALLFALVGATVLWWLGPTTPVFAVRSTYSAIPDRDESL